MWNKRNLSMMFAQLMFGLSYYGVMVILTRFFLEELNYSEAKTVMVTGAFAAVGPLFVVIGAFIADKLLGAYRSVTLSYVAFTTGFAFLVFGASTHNVTSSLFGIAVASYARGLMWPSYQSLFKKTFTSEVDFENAFPINYSVNNLGAVIGQYFFPLIILLAGFYFGFLISTVMAGAAMVLLFIMEKPLKSVGKNIDKEPVNMSDWGKFIGISIVMLAVVYYMFFKPFLGQYILYAVVLMAILYFFYTMSKAEESHKWKMGTIIIIFFLAAAFHVYYGQMMTSMTLVSINTMRGDLFGFIPIAPEASMSFNPFWCMIAGPVIVFIFTSLEKRGIHFGIATKISFSFILSAIAFGILAIATMNVGSNAVVRPEIFFLVHFFQAFGELIIGTMAVAFILSVTPKHIENFSVSLYLLASAVSAMLSGVFSTNIALEKGAKVTQEFVQNTYGTYYMDLTLFAVFMVFVALISTFIIRKMLAKSEELKASTTAS